MNAASLNKSLLEAARNGDAKEVRRCLAGGAEADCANNGALVWAVIGGHLDVLEALAEAGAPLEKDLQEDDGASTYVSYVTLAYDKKQWDIAEYLIEKGADPHLRIGVVSGGIMADAPLEKLKVFARASIAAEKMQDTGEQKDSVWFLSMAMVEGRNEALDWFLGEGHLNEETKRVIFQRAIVKRPEFLPLLKKYDIFYHDDDGYGTPLLRAIDKLSLRGVAALLALGADPNQMFPFPPLLQAIAGGKHEMAAALLEAGADVFMRGGEAMVRAAGQDKSLYDMVKKHFALQQAEWLEKFNKKFEGLAAQEILSADNLPYGQSGLLMAVKAGIFPDFLERMRKENAFFDDADPLLLVQQDDHLTSALRLLLTTGRLDLLVDHRLWKQPEKGLNSLLPFLPEHDIREDFQKKVTEMLISRAASEDIDLLRRKMGDKNRFRL